MTRAAKAVDGKHNLEVIGSNPVPATNTKLKPVNMLQRWLAFFFIFEEFP